MTECFTFIKANVTKSRLSIVFPHLFLFLTSLPPWSTEMLSYPRRILCCATPHECFHLVWFQDFCIPPPDQAPPRIDMIQGLHHCIRSSVTYPLHCSPRILSAINSDKKSSLVFVDLASRIASYCSSVLRYLSTACRSSSCCSLHLFTKLCWSFAFVLPNCLCDLTDVLTCTHYRELVHTTTCHRRPQPCVPDPTFRG